MIHDAAESASPRGSGVVIDPNGNIVVEGNTKVDGNPGSVLVAQLTPNGTLDPTFGIGGIKIESPPPNNSFAAEGVALESNGNIIVAGSDSGYPLLCGFSAARRPLHSRRPAAAGAPLTSLKCPAGCRTRSHSIPGARRPPCPPMPPGRLRPRREAKLEGRSLRRRASGSRDGRRHRPEDRGPGTRPDFRVTGPR